MMIPTISKTDAFSTWQDVPSIPLDFSKHDFQFTRGWFRVRNQATWSAFLPYRFCPYTLFERQVGEDVLKQMHSMYGNSVHPKPAMHSVNMIQIGVFEGYDLAWCCQHILRNPDSRALAIDPWAATTKLDAEYMEGCYKRTLHNLKPYRRKVAVERGSSHEVLKQIHDNPPGICGKVINPGQWHLIVIDGDHNAPAVYEDAVDSLRLAAHGAWLVFDDYHNRIDKKDHVQAGVAKFVEDFGDQVKLAWFHRYCVCLEKL